MKYIDFLPKLNLLRKKRHTLSNDLDLIRPKYRNKRGLINGLGGIIKTITGNMDYEDHVEINTKLNSLQSTQNEIGNQMKNQIYINTQMLRRFNNITKHINKQQEHLEKYLNNFHDNIIEKLDVIERTLHINQYFEQILFNMDMLSEHLNDISESLLLAKLGIISKHILHPTEINYVSDMLKEQSINVFSDENIYEFLELQAYYNHTNIIFIIKIPMFHPNSFSFYHLKELPINNSYTIQIKTPFLLLSEYFQQYVNKPCLTIEKIRYCQKESIQPNTVNGCVPNIINNQPANCTLITNTDVGDIIEMFEPEHLLIISQNEVAIETSCGTNIKHKSLKGILLIHFKNCSISINGFEYRSRTPIYWDTIEIISTIYNDIQHHEIVEKLNFQKLNNWTLENLKEIIVLKQTTNQSFKSLIAGFTVLLIIIFYIIYKIVNQFNLKQCRKNPIQQDEPTITATTNDTTNPGTLWPSLHS